MNTVVTFVVSGLGDAGKKTVDVGTTGMALRQAFELAGMTFTDKSQYISPVRGPLAPESFVVGGDVINVVRSGGNGSM